MAARLAGKLVGAVPFGQRFLQRGGKELLGQSIPGALITAGISTLTTGNPLAGLAVGGTDLLTSSLLARGLASQGLNTALAKRGLPTTAGRFHRSVDINNVRSMRDVVKQPLVYHASGPQNFAMLAGSVGSTLAVEPRFYPRGQQGIQGQQLAQMKYMNDLDPTTAHGTMYQMQGIPMRATQEDIMFAEVGQQLRKGWTTASNLMRQQGGYSHTVFQPQFYRDLAKGSAGGKGTSKITGSTGYIDGSNKVRRTNADPITFKTPLQLAGAVGARLVTDAGEDASRRFYWHYNHPMPISDSVSNKFLGKKLAADLKPKQIGGSGRFGPTQRSLIRLAALGIPVGASLGHLDLTNPGEMFRAKGFKQKYAEQGSEDRRKTDQAGPEFVDRVLLGRRGQPLKYETAKEEIPNLTPERYGRYMKHAYQNKGLTGLGLLKFTGENLEGHPELSVVGFPVGLQAVGAGTGGTIGLNKALQTKASTLRIAGRSGKYALAGALAGKLSNMAIASANRPQYQSTLAYD